MKKNLLTAFSLLVISANAQYFEHVYGSTSYEEVSSGMNTVQVGTGFVIGGTRTTTNGANVAVSVARTDIAGNVSGSPYFKKSYAVYTNSGLGTIMKIRQGFVVEETSTRFGVAGVCYKDNTLQKYAVYYAQID